ncbi:endonuclease/exonuclease/phosphatase family protein [Paraburkholderia kururiensis]|uniref:Endonuclease/exonuclease/phosphatase family protein n=1 Tax=Paraburkholderia kururiensis TaxID=984307 RepID=A0ABZ0WN93_9BURK|nr:endonuclease/exonuclease/phosphatase family protein [Paraburkholderia kururiensis]WQD78849.1 endonuclease/exonuclease/phosphatase family protein [Paraburkholderia kururiensis]
MKTGTEFTPLSAPKRDDPASLAGNDNHARAAELRIATWNIHGATGADRVQSAERIAAVVGELDADIVALQEVPLGDARTPNALDVLRAATGLHAVEGPTLDTPRRRFGNAVLSRLPVRAARTLDLSFGQREPRGALDVDLHHRGETFRVVATHLGLSARERRAQIHRLLSAFDRPDLPVILLGDINEWFVWGRALRMLVEHFRAAPAPRTFPARWPVFALDRIWMHPGERLIDVRAHASPLARIASDHLPLVARVAASPQRATTQRDEAGRAAC